MSDEYQLPDGARGEGEFDEKFIRLLKEMDETGVDYIVFAKTPPITKGKDGFTLFSNIQDKSYIGYVIKKIAEQITVQVKTVN